MSNILDRLRSASTGYKEWRVQHPVDGAYCMSFSKRDSTNPERDAREWLKDHQRAYPESRFSQYVVACVDMLTDGDRLAMEAADEITRLRAELANARAADVHSCGPTCTRAGCVNGMLRAERDEAREQVAIYAAERDEARTAWSNRTKELERMEAERDGLREEAINLRAQRDAARADRDYLMAKVAAPKGTT